MEKMYFVTRVNIDQTGKQANSIQQFSDEKQARKRFYSILAADIDSENYQFEMVQIVRDDGICVASQVFDNRVAPEPVVEG
jgi:hypothetical protein